MILSCVYIYMVKSYIYMYILIFVLDSTCLHWVKLRPQDRRQLRVRPSPQEEKGLAGFEPGGPTKDGL